MLKPPIGYYYGVDVKGLNLSYHKMDIYIYIYVYIYMY